MSVQLNKVFIVGNLTRDPELRYTTSGTGVCSFTVAVNKKYTSNGEQKEEVSFIRVQAWGKLAETTAEYLTKGSQVLVEGSLKQERWEDQEGQKKDKTIVSALAVQFLSSKPKSEESSERPGREEVESIDVDDLQFGEDCPF